MRQRGRFGKLARILFISFNVLMSICVVATWLYTFFDQGPLVQDLDAALFSENDVPWRTPDKTPVVSAVSLSATLALLIWLPGALILGFISFLTRGKYKSELSRHVEKSRSNSNSQ